MSSGTLCIALLVALQLLMVTTNHCPLYQHAGQIARIDTCTKSQKQIKKEKRRGPRYSI